MRFEFHQNQVSASEEFMDFFLNVVPYQLESWFILFLLFIFIFSIQKHLLPFETYTQQLYQGKKMTMRDSEA